MTKYKLEIADSVNGKQMPLVEFEEEIQEEAKAKSYKVLLDAAENYPDGEYVGQLYRKNFFCSWQEVASPVISCIVSNGKVTLTVVRVRYNRENSLITKLKQHCNTISIFMQQAANAMLFSASINPKQVIKLMDDAKQTLRTLLDDYRPDYLDMNLYNNIELQINTAQQAIQTTYSAYNQSAILDNYTTTLTAELQKVQLILMEFIRNKNL